VQEKNNKFIFLYCIIVFLASEDRATMVTYWKRNSNPNADKINRFEYPEVLECLPDLDGKRILELGAGIGFVFVIEV
jgi:hypothetical protein